MEKLSKLILDNESAKAPFSVGMAKRYIENEDKSKNKSFMSNISALSRSFMTA